MKINRFTHNVLFLITFITSVGVLLILLLALTILSLFMNGDKIDTIITKIRANINRRAIK